MQRKQLRLLVELHVPVEEANVQKILERCGPTAKLEGVELVDGPNTRSAVIVTPRAPKPEASKPERGTLTPEKIEEAKKLIARGISQKVIAMNLGVSRSSIAHIAQGRRDAPAPTKTAKPGPKRATAKATAKEAKAS